MVNYSGAFFGDGEDVAVWGNGVEDAGFGFGDKGFVASGSEFSEDVSVGRVGDAQDVSGGGVAQVDDACAGGGDDFICGDGPEG